MFTWICPQCGRDVPPSASECPTCAQRQAAAAQPPVMAPPPPPPAPQQQYQPPPQQQFQPPPQQQYQPPPPQYQPPPPQYQAAPQQQYQQPPPQQSYVIGEPKKGLPSWLVGILVTAVIGGGLFGVYKLLETGPQTESKASDTALERPTPGAASAAGGVYGKFLEVTGYRLLEGADKKPRVRFTVVNHSTATMTGLQLELSLGRVGADGEPPFAVVDAIVGNIEANGTVEMELPIKTKLRIYELPDWQFIKGTFTVTAPK